MHHLARFPAATGFLSCIVGKLEVRFLRLFPAAKGFPYRLFVAAIVLIAVSHGPAADLHGLTLAPGGIPQPLLTFTACCILGFCALRLYQQRFAESPFWLALLGVVLAGHWLALDFHYFLTKLFHFLVRFVPLPEWLLVSGGLIATAVAAWLVHHWRHELETGRSLVREKATEFLAARPPIRALVLIVSKPSVVPQFSGTNTGFPATLQPPKTAPAGTPPTTLHGVPAQSNITASLQNDITAAGLWFWNWQQLLRAVLPHQKNLDRVVLVGSKDSQLPAARKLLAAYLPKLDESTLTCLPPLDLEQFDELLNGLRRVVIDTWPEAGFLPHEIAVDITGGIKVASVAAAVLTLNRAVLCQYVQTEGLNAAGEPEPYIYDFRWDPSLVLGH